MRKLPYMLAVLMLCMATSGYCADTKVSALDNLGANPATTDELYLSDAGVDKAITYSNLVLDLGSAGSFEIPNSSDPDVDAVGEISYDTDNGAMRVFSNAEQMTLAQTATTICFTVAQPDELDETDKLFVWQNNLGKDFTITRVEGIADDDHTGFVLDEYDEDGSSNTAEIATMTCITGGGPYTTSATTVVVIENLHRVAFDADATDTPDYVAVTFKGWLSADD